ncbi:MAG TPA: GTP-binding protein [Cellvibrionaceae bacterium]|nr:GTP-binding protein [Cellvibrionaceae bacterium]HMY39612.1 GTP-binding protein [Marinagarivorans sp.]HNG61019.1 GTP-binding protein [Cellvibrionaceae bacterium]
MALAHPQAQPLALQPVWSVEGIDTPESVLEVVNKRQNYFLVSSIGGDPFVKDGVGGLVKINGRGEILDKNWLSGLNAPKGMAQFKDKVYVADIDEVVVVDINTAQVVEKIPMPGAIMLNDVAADERGTIYISDTFAARVYRLKNHKVDVYLEEVVSANGLWAEPDRLLVGAANQLLAYNAAKKSKQIGSDLPLEIDGITPFKCNSYLVSSWEGQIWSISKKGEQTLLLDSVAEGINTADIMYSESAKLLFVPNFFANKVSAYKVKGSAD